MDLPKIFARFSWKDLPPSSSFCDWLSETMMISAYNYDWFFRNYISIVFLSFIVLISE